MIHGDDRFRVSKGKRLQQDSIDDAEDRRVRTNAERQYRKSGQREAGMLAEAADGVTQWLEQIVHEYVPSGVRVRMLLARWKLLLLMRIRSGVEGQVSAFGTAVSVRGTAGSGDLGSWT